MEEVELLHERQIEGDVLKKRMATIESQIQAMGNTEELVERLPKRFQHPVMVPLGPRAIVKGNIVHTNEVLCALGEGYFAWRTSEQAREIIKRRVALLETQKERVRERMKQIGVTMDPNSQSYLRDGVLHIHEIEEGEEKGKEKAPVPTKPTSGKPKEKKGSLSREEEERELAAFLARADELERLEEEEGGPERVGEPDRGVGSKNGAKKSEKRQGKKTSDVARKEQGSKQDGRNLPKVTVEKAKTSASMSPALVKTPADIFKLLEKWVTTSSVADKDLDTSDRHVWFAEKPKRYSKDAKPPRHRAVKATAVSPILRPSTPPALDASTLQPAPLAEPTLAPLGFSARPGDAFTGVVLERSAEEEDRTVQKQQQPRKARSRFRSQMQDK